MRKKSRNQIRWAYFRENNANIFCANITWNSRNITLTCVGIIYYVKSFFRSFTKTWSWNILQEITETLISIDLTPFDFTIKKLPYLATLYSYYLLSIHQTVWITELQDKVWLKGSNSANELCRNTLTKKGARETL